MGMNVGNAGGGGDPEVMVDINTTPLIDVMLVLLIMLIITIPIQLHAVNLDLPVGAPPTSDAKPETVKIDIDAQDTVYWQGIQVGAAPDLEDKMRAAATQAVQPVIELRSDKAAHYAVVAKVLADTRRIGLTKIGVVGSEQFVEWHE